MMKKEAAAMLEIIADVALPRLVQNHGTTGTPLEILGAELPILSPGHCFVCVLTVIRSSEVKPFADGVQQTMTAIMGRAPSHTAELDEVSPPTN